MSSRSRSFPWFNRKSSSSILELFIECVISSVVEPKGFVVTRGDKWVYSDAIIFYIHNRDQRGFLTFSGLELADNDFQRICDLTILRARNLLDLPFDS